MEKDLRHILRQYWGYDDFRGIQAEIINSVMKHQDTLGLMPTGGGKSITFQVPAMAMDGVCIVVTPLIALMKDQVANLKKRGIKAEAIYTGIPHHKIITILENAIFGGVKFLYIAPERLTSQLFLEKLKRIDVCLITVDEAHCISQWGYDFRPSYLAISEIRKQKPETNILALTATATKKVTEDIMERLEFKEKNVFRMSFARKNLAYIVRETPDKFKEMVHILNSLNGSSIVYVRKRSRTTEISKFLVESGISAIAYHAGLDSLEKDRRQTMWQDDEVRVMVATNAFGMGIDKPDVRLVIHFDCPDSIEAYFQEAGRGGRDGKKAYAVMLYTNRDSTLLKRRIAENFPEKEAIRNIYEHLGSYYQLAVGDGAECAYQFNIDKFCSSFHHNSIQVEAALKILQRAGYLQYETEDSSQSRIMFLLERDELYKLRNQSPDEDRLITTLLRNYTGLFTKYVYLNEEQISEETGFSLQRLYQLFISLSRRHIVSYVPRSKMPYIRYCTDRIDGDKIILSPEVYDIRKEQYEKRVGAMVRYLEDNHICRSQHMLSYFGETLSKPCKQCDVCVDMKKNATVEQAAKYILSFLGDKKRHSLSELNSLPLNSISMNEAIRKLIAEEEIKVDSKEMWI